MTAERELATKARAWPFEEARRLVARAGGAAVVQAPAKGYMLLETGYGPSGLPHIGTFAEVARTTMVRHAFQRLSDIPSRLLAFSDDMDGLRKVPENLPNREMLARHLGKPLTAVPDPFGTHASFGEHNNARLRAFLDRFGFEYEFKSSTECYRSGLFDETLRRVLAHHDEIRDLVLPTLGAERQSSYSPFLPISPRSGVVLQVLVVETRPAAGTILYRDPETDALVEQPVTGGHCKLQWKVDWAMRWAALGVDYEMSGKDLIDSVRLSGKICRVIGALPPEGFTYELFLDEKGEKISKSRGNGITIDEWLAYAPPESLSLFMYQKPRAAKRLYFDVIPRQTDDYLALVEAYERQSPEERLENPVWHIHDGAPPEDARTPLGFALLLNLASVCHTEDKAVLWGFIARYAPAAGPATHPFLDRLVGYAIAYYHDFVRPATRYRRPTEEERAALEDLRAMLATLPPGAEAEAIQTQVYEIGKRHGFDLRDWFKALYEVLLGHSQGPRMGSFIALYGVAETIALLDRVLAGEDLSAA
jgi:lysyl-tRNA synthetase, class I